MGTKINTSNTKIIWNENAPPISEWVIEELKKIYKKKYGYEFNIKIVKDAN